MEDKQFKTGEILITIGVIIILIIVGVQSYTKYISKAQRASNVQNAQQIVDALDLLKLEYNLDTVNNSVIMLECGKDTELNDITQIDTNKDAYSNIECILGHIPECSYGKGWYWCLNISENNSLDIYLVAEEDSKRTEVIGYKLYPDATNYLENAEKEIYKQE